MLLFFFPGGEVQEGVGRGGPVNVGKIRCGVRGGVFRGGRTPLWREGVREGERHAHNGVAEGELETEARICSTLVRSCVGTVMLRRPYFPGRSKNTCKAQMTYSEACVVRGGGV